MAQEAVRRFELKDCKIIAGGNLILRDSYRDEDGFHAADVIVAPSKHEFNMTGIEKFGTRAWSNFIDSYCTESNTYLLAIKEDLESYFNSRGIKTVSSDAKMFKSILDQMFNTYVHKNNDYGNSFGDTYEAFGDLGIITAVALISNKCNQLVGQAVRGVKARVEEPVEDTLIDMAKYCILAVVERRKEMERERGAEVSGSQIEMITDAVGDEAKDVKA